jgi:intracellular septation protein
MITPPSFPRAASAATRPAIVRARRGASSKDLVLATLFAQRRVAYGTPRPMNTPQAPPNSPRLSPNAKLAVDFGPLVLFLVANSKLGIRWGTAAFMGAMLIAIAYSWKVERRVSLMAWVTLGFVLVFGGLTVWLDSDVFIKVKVTVIEVLIGAALLIGLAFDKLLIKHVLGASLSIDDIGWRRLTLRFALFSLALAAANEWVRASLTTDQWLWFKVAGIPVATIAFMLAQMSLLKRHAQPSADDSTRA